MLDRSYFMNFSAKPDRGVAASVFKNNLFTVQPGANEINTAVSKPWYFFPMIVYGYPFNYTGDPTFFYKIVLY